MNVQSNNNLEMHLWYRFFKVVYGGTFIVTLVFFAVFVYNQRPHYFTYDQYVNIRCTSGTIYTEELDNPWLFFTEKDIITKIAVDPQRLCAYGRTTKYYIWDQYPTPENKNFHLEPYQKQVGSWRQWTVVTIIIFTIIMFIFHFTRRVLFYILGIKE